MAASRDMDDIIQQLDIFHEAAFRKGSPVSDKAKYYSALDAFFAQDPALAVRIVHDQRRKYAHKPLQQREEIYMRGAYKTLGPKAIYDFMNDLYFNPDASGGRMYSDMWVNQLYADVAIAYTQELMRQEKYSEIADIITESSKNIDVQQDGRDGFIGDLTRKMREASSSLAREIAEKGDVSSQLRILSRYVHYHGNGGNIISGLADIIDRDPRAALDILTHSIRTLSETDPTEIRKCLRLLLAQDGIKDSERFYAMSWMEEAIGGDPGISRAELISFALDGLQKNPDDEEKKLLQQHMTASYQYGDGELPPALIERYRDYNEKHLLQAYFSQPGIDLREDAERAWRWDLNLHLKSFPDYIERLTDRQLGDVISCFPAFMPEQQTLSERAFERVLNTENSFIQPSGQILALAGFLSEKGLNETARVRILEVIEKVLRENPTALFSTSYNRNILEMARTHGEDAMNARNDDDIQALIERAVDLDIIFSAPLSDIAVFTLKLTRDSSHKGKESSLTGKFADKFVAKAADFFNAAGHLPETEKAGVYSMLAETLSSIHGIGRITSLRNERIVKIFEAMPVLLGCQTARIIPDLQYKALYDKKSPQAAERCYQTACRLIIAQLRSDPAEGLDSLAHLSEPFSDFRQNQNAIRLEDVTAKREGLAFVFSGVFKENFANDPEKMAYLLGGLQMDDIVKKEMQIWIMENHKDLLMSLDPIAYSEAIGWLRYGDNKDLTNRAKAECTEAGQAAEKYFGIHAPEGLLDHAPRLMLT